MKTKLICIITFLALIICIFINLDLVPLRREISDLEIVMVAGMDKTEKGYEISFLKKKKQEANSGDDTQSNESDSVTQVVSIEAENYDLAMRQLKTLTDKYITASHIKYFIIGEKTAEDDLTHVIDTIARGYQTRLNSKVYISKSMTAKEFLQKASKSDYNVQEKLKNMEDSFWNQRLSTPTDLTDVGNIFLSTKGDGIMATLNFEEKETLDTKSVKIGEEKTNESKDTEKGLFEFSGAALIKDMKLVDYLSSDEMTTANYILINNSVDLISIKYEDAVVTFGLQNIKSDISFRFSKDDIVNEVIINIRYEANYEEADAVKPIFTLDMINYFNAKLNENVKSKVQNIINLEFEKDIDFLNLEKKLEFSNPYKYEKNRRDIMENFKKCKFSINVRGKIQTTYDVVESNIKQKGDNT